MEMDEKEIAKICEITGLVYCDSDCLCGRENQMLYIHDCTKKWVPDWMNCTEPYEVVKWLKDNGRW